jgi:hypothetical protein
MARRCAGQPALSGRPGALHGTPDGIWVDHEPTLEAVRAYLAGGPAPAAAVDALVNCYRDNAGKLAAFNSLYERPADTRDLRASLAGDAAQGT